MTGIFILLNTDLEFVAVSGNHLATDGATDIFKSTLYLVLFNYIPGYQTARRSQYYTGNRVRYQT